MVKNNLSSINYNFDLFKFNVRGNPNEYLNSDLNRIIFFNKYIISSVPCSGHVFWDTETWMFPGLLLLHPDIARDNLLQYRINHQDGAMTKARSYNPPYDGTMFPWESAFTGQETCLPMFKTGEYEHHISGDVAFAMRQYWDLTQDSDWLTSRAYPVVRGIAKFWASRVSFENGEYVINGVVPPDESSFGNNSGRST